MWIGQLDSEGVSKNQRVYLLEQFSSQYYHCIIRFFIYTNDIVLGDNPKFDA